MLITNSGSVPQASEITDPILTTEASNILGCSQQTVRAWERSGRLRAFKTRRGVRLFDRADVERLARERASASTADLAKVG